MLSPTDATAEIVGQLGVDAGLLPVEKPSRPDEEEPDQ